MAKVAFIFVFVTLLAGCDRRTPSTMAAAISKAVISEPSVASFERLYPGSEHFISYYSGAYGQPSWTSETLIHGRYQLTMRFDIAIDRAGTTVAAIGPPQFWLNKRRHVQRLPDGRLHLSYAPDGGAKFDAAEWEKLVSASGRLSVLGIGEIDTTPVVESPYPAPQVAIPPKPVD